VPELTALGVRRVSTGGGLARVAYAALLVAARELQTTGTFAYLDSAVPGSDLEAALAAGAPPRR
jgi:2-methylisocitrate lyase-like PEP mutase family enzyme